MAAHENVAPLCTGTSMTHILERFFIHFSVSTFLTLAAFMLLNLWLRRNGKVNNWLSSKKEHLLITSALIVFSLATLREPFDVAAGQWWVKAITDQVSWFVGPALSAWGLYRYGKIQ